MKEEFQNHEDEGTYHCTARSEGPDVSGQAGENPAEPAFGSNVGT
jgi:hypothetical protein